MYSVGTTEIQTRTRIPTMSLIKILNLSVAGLRYSKISYVYYMLIYHVKAAESSRELKLPPPILRCSCPHFVILLFGLVYNSESIFNNNSKKMCCVIEVIWEGNYHSKSFSAYKPRCNQ